MKLNYKRTVLVGMAFLLISACWQAYDAIIPLMLTNHFGLPHIASGTIMSLDNVLAAFLLPLFGSISDRTRTRLGRRTPFIILGTVVAAITFVLLTFIDNYQLARVIAAGIPNLEQGALSEVDFEQHILSTTFELTVSNPLPLVGFVATLLVLLIAMAIFRSPAVALMPDVTVKPLRSKGNAVINLTGTAGGILVLVFGMLFATSEEAYMQYTGYVLAVVGVMIVALVVFMLTVKENEWAADMEQKSARLGIDREVSVGGSRNLAPAEVKSLLLILASVALWYIGYNAITSKYSVYATNVLGFDFNKTLIIAQAAAVVSYIPVGMISSRFGRKKTILAGVFMLASAFFIGNFVTSSFPEPAMFAVFSLAGIGWATINVNSFPMVVELSRGSDVGKFTGYYYTASMAAQIVAPILSGILFDLYDIRYVFFPFGTVFVALSFVTMCFVKHGDSKPEQRRGLEALDIED